MGLLQEKEKVSTLRPSLFPNMPLYLNFVPANSLPDIKIRSLSEGLKNMRWTVVAPKGKIPASDITQKEGWAIQGDIYIRFILLIILPLRLCKVQWLQHILGDIPSVH